MYLTEQFLNAVLAITAEAGEILADFYLKSVKVYNKSDNTPVTEADLFLSQFLMQRLSELTPTIPILSEENCNIPLEQRMNWDTYWLIDPLDGTQNFIDRTDQFAILISLVHKNRPILGVIHAPILQSTYYAMAGFGAYRKQGQQITSLPKRKIDLTEPLKIVLGSANKKEKVRSILPKNFAHEFLIYGSSGLKSALVADGTADCYVRLGRTGEWDTAAAEILLQEVNGVIFDPHFASLTYNQRDTFVNPDFVMCADMTLNWQHIFHFEQLK
ncbi:3'(2'),5'-bisphosphate nucleotidase CysQ [Pasteurellaceae bacterium 22721_9_1]